METPMQNGVTIPEDELKNIYRTTRSAFLMLHRVMIRKGLMPEHERLILFDLTQTKK